MRRYFRIGYYSFYLSLLCFAGWLLQEAEAAERLFPLTPSSVTNAYVLPEGFEPRVIGKGKAEGWKIEMDEAPSFFAPLSPEAKSNSKQPVIAQTARAKVKSLYPVLMYEDEVFGDFTLTLKVKMVDGEMSQAVGVLFRAQNIDNCYGIIADAKEGSFRFFKRVNGVEFPSLKGSCKIEKGVWYDLRVECRGNLIRCKLGEWSTPDITDTSYNSGMFALLTQADSVSYFCELGLDYTPRYTIAEVAVAAALKRYDKLEDLKLFAKPPGKNNYEVVAAKNSEDIGSPASQGALDCIRNNAIYTGETRRSWTVTMPLHDENGDPMGAVTVVLKKFMGQTKKNAINRGTAVMKRIQSHVTTADELLRK